MLQVNDYFDGNVKSIGFQNDQGRVTAGVMAPGEYEFATSETERVVVTCGCLLVRLPGTDTFEAFRNGESFNVAAKVTFELKVNEATAYLCFYGE